MRWRGGTLKAMSRQLADFSHQPERLRAYLDNLPQAAGHADRAIPLQNYTKGLQKLTSMAIDTRPEST